MALAKRPRLIFSEESWKQRQALQKNLDLPARDARNHTGYLTQQFSLYPDLSVDENIHYSAGLRLVPEDQLDARRTKYLKLMQLEPFRDRLAGRLSGGMKQKLALCCALVAEPQGYCWMSQRQA